MRPLETTSLYKFLSERVHNDPFSAGVRRIPPSLSTTSERNFFVASWKLANIIGNSDKTHGIRILRNISREMHLDAILILMVITMRVLCEGNSLEFFLRTCRHNGIKFCTTRTRVVRKECDVYFMYYRAWEEICDHLFSSNRMYLEFDDVIDIAHVRFMDESTVLHKCVKKCREEWGKSNVIKVINAVPADLWLCVDREGNTPLHFWNASDIPISILDILEIVPASVCTIQNDSGELMVHTASIDTLDCAEFCSLWVACGSPSVIDEFGYEETLLQEICESPREALEKCVFVMKDFIIQPIHHDHFMRALHAACMHFQSGDLLRVLLNYINEDEAWNSTKMCHYLRTDNSESGDFLIQILSYTIEVDPYEHVRSMHGDMLTVDAIDDRFLALLEKLPDDRSKLGEVIYASLPDAHLSTVEICCKVASSSLVDKLLDLIPPPVKFTVEQTCTLINNAYKLPKNQDKGNAMCRVVEEHMHDREAVRSFFMLNYADYKEYDHMMSILYP